MGLPEKMATLLFYHSPIFSLIMVGVGAEDPELGCSIGLLVLGGTHFQNNYSNVAWKCGSSGTVPAL
jgi:hypothetical protein